MNKNHGFTLIELIVTMAVIAILFAVAAPDIMFTTSSNRLTDQYNDMRGDFAFARNEAITLNLPVTISSYNGTDWSQGWAIVSPTKTLRISNKVNNMTISSAIASMSYNPDGSTNLTATTNIKLCGDTTGGKQLTIAISGQVSRQDVSCP